MSDLRLPADDGKPEDIIHWAYKTFADRLIVTSSFQTHSIPLLHMVSRIAPDIEVIFLDTGFHFEESLAFRDRVAKQLDLRIRNVRCEIGHAAFLARYGALYAEDPDRCCYINKIDPLESVLANADAWITGLRRDQSATRSSVPVTFLRDDGKIKIAPLANVTRDEIEVYRTRFRLPEHPLEGAGYRSVSCSPCTRRTPVGGGDRAGRWAGTSKSECGLHDDYFNPGKAN